MRNLTVMEEFRKRKRKRNLKVVHRSTEVHKLPERSIMAKQIWICVCGEENNEDRCWSCGRERVFG